MTQFPINLNDATTGHKLQGMSKENIIIPAFPNKKLRAMFKNWEYVVLSRVRTLSGLYLLEPIDMNESFKPSEEFTQFLHRARARMNALQKRRETLLNLIKMNTVQQHN